MFRKFPPRPYAVRFGTWACVGIFGLEVNTVSHYRKIDVRIWNDEKFNSLPNESKLAFIFVLTHPNMTSLGAMRGTVEGLAAELEALPEAFAEALSKGLFKVDPKAKIIHVPNFIKYNKPESPNVVKAWGKAFELLPEGCVKNKIYQSVKDSIKGYDKGYAKAFSEAFPKDLPESVSSEQ